MSATSRTARLPFDHLLAELAAFPIASEAALRHPITHLDPQMGGATAELWREAERELLPTAPGVSLDDLVAMRDGCWFGSVRADDRTPVSLQSFLRTTALRHMEELGGGIAARRPAMMQGPLSATPAHAQARRSWMWLTFALPEDLLLAVLADPGRRDWMPEPDLLAPSVRELLSRGFAETHLHVGAALDFRSVWSLVTARLASPGMGDGDVEAPGALLDEGRHLTDWLLRAAIGRVVLAGFLTRPGATTLPGHLHSRVYRGHLVDRAGAGAFSTVVTALSDLTTGSLSPLPRPLLQDAYRGLVGTAGPAPATNVSQVWALDPLTTLLPPGPGSPEQRLVSLTCSAAAGAAGLDDVATHVFWQTVRVRTVLYRHVTQRPLTPGLPWFIRFYGRMSRARGSVPASLLVEAAAERSGSRHGMTSLEMRTSPDEAMSELLNWVRAVHELADGPAETGLVFHFVKQREGEVALGVPRVGGQGTTADPATNPGGFRFSRFFAGQRSTAITLGRLLHRWPRTLHLVRGLDVCADELAVPIWVMRPLVDHVRQAAMLGARHLRRLGEPWQPPLRTTVHAGEDFSHLLTGLRQVHEAADVLDLREGDRIGHAVALGVEPGEWAARIGRVAMPIEDRVLDLAWEWTWWTRRGHGGDAARLAYLAREVNVIGEQWLGMRTTPFDLEQLSADLVDTDRLAAVGFPDRIPSSIALTEQRNARLLRYLTDRGAFTRGRRIVWVDPAGEVDALRRIAASLRADIGRRGLAIEINPTSNLLIGDLADLDNHPLWRLRPPRPVPDTVPLAVTVGSDDPLVFNSDLPGEYQLLYDTLLLAGLSDAQALSWLDDVRSTGLERRFTTLPAGADPFGIENLASLDPPAL